MPAEHGDLDLPPVDGLLDEDPLVVGQGVVDGVAQLLDRLRLRHPDGRAHVGRLDEARETQLARQLRRQSGRALVIGERPVAGLGNPVGGQHLLGHRLVHRQRRAEHAGSDVGDVGQLEQALHGAVLTHRPVQQRQHDRPLVVGRRQGGERRHRGAGRVEPLGQLGHAGSQCLLGALRQCPLAVGGDADRRHAVTAGIDGSQHVRGGHAADVVLRRLAAEQHDEVRPRLRHDQDGTVAPRAVPGIPGRRGDRRAPRWTRRRAARCVVRQPITAAWRPVRADHRRA